MTRAILAALAGYWRRNPLQLLTLLVGVALATALWSGVQAINAEARASYANAAAALGDGQMDQILPRDGQTMPLDRFATLRRAGWLVSPVVEGRWQGMRLLGIDPLTIPGSTTAGAAAGRVDPGALLRDGAILGHPATLERLPSEASVPVLADPGMATGTLVTDLATAQRLLGLEGRITRLIVLGEQPLRQVPLDIAAPDLLRRSAEQAPDIGQLTGSFHLNLTAFGLLSFVVGLFIVHGAVGLALEQRRTMVRTMRALGVPLSRLVWVLVAELGLLAFLAGGGGLILGHLIAAALMPDVAATLRGLYGAEVSGSLRLRPVWVAAGLGIAVAGTLAASAGALWRIARMPVLASGAPRAWGLASARRLRLQALSAAVLLGLACGLAWIQPKGLLAGFVLLGTLLAGGALALTPLVAKALEFAQARARRPLAQWFWADTRQQLPGLGLALMALMLAMAANVGVSTMVSSFRLTFVGFIEQRLAPELYIGPEGRADLARLDAFVTARGGEVLPLRSVRAGVADMPAEVWGIRVGRTYRENWRFLSAQPEAWDRVARGEGAVINEQLARRAGLGPGDRLPLPQGQALSVVGIVGDYGNPIGQVIVADAVFDRLFPDVMPERFALRTADPELLRRDLVRDLGIAQGAITDQAAVKALSLAIFDRTFAVTGALNVLTLAVAGFAMLLSLLTLAAMRLPQLAPVWAMGVTQTRLAWLELGRSVLLAGMAAVLALPLGLALAWALLSVVNVAAFGWRLPMSVFPAEYLRLMALALGAAVLAAAWPAWRLARQHPAALLGVFAHER